MYKVGQKDFIKYWLQFVDIVRVYDQHDEKGRLVDPEVRKRMDIINVRKPCRKIFTDMIIYWNGRLALCNYDWDEKRPIGDVSITTLLDAWNSREYEEIRNKHFCNTFCNEICKECHHWKIDYTENGYLGKSYSSTSIQ